MAPKRSVKTVCVTSNNNNYNNLALTDVSCPICRSILIEPVTLPCSHGFCSSCFNGTVANTNLVCPLCRVRIGSWLRTSRKDNKLVNSVLWDAIQRTFPEQVKNKLAGTEEYPEEDIPRRLTAPGEIRREYELQKAKEQLELQKQREVEAKASEDYIKKLKEQEDFEESVREENLRLSEQVAKKLAQEYCFDPGPSSSKFNVLPPNSVKKQGPIDRLLKNMSQKKLSVTVQPVSESSTTNKEYSCKILCQDRSREHVNKSSSIDKAALRNWKIQDKLRKIVTEGEASDSNDSIDSECRYFKPIEQRYIPISRKVPIVKVPAKVVTASTVIIGPPKGETNFTHATFASAFAVVRIITFPVSIPEKEPAIKSKSSPLKRKSTGSTCDMTVTELASEESTSKIVQRKSPRRHTRSSTQSMEAPCTSPNIIKKQETRKKLHQKSPVKATDKTPEKSRNSARRFSSYSTPSKRKRLRSSPFDEETSPKRTKVPNANQVISPAFHGFDNRNLNELKAKTNGAITVDSINLNNVDLKHSNSDIKNNLKKLQEEEDLKLAQQLHDELNNRSRYSTRNSISLRIKNVKKPTARQATLTELISQTVNKIP